MRHRFPRSLLLLVMGIIATLPRAAHAQVGSVLADYNVTSADNSGTTIVNLSAFGFTHMVWYELGYNSSGNCPGDTRPQAGTTGLRIVSAFDGATVAAGKSVSFPSLFRDFDDTFAGGTTRIIWAVSSNGLAVKSDLHSPNVNASGHFVGFLGNDINGCEADGDRTGSGFNGFTVPPTFVANINVSCSFADALELLREGQEAGSVSPQALSVILESLRIAQAASGSGGNARQRAGALACALCLVREEERSLRFGAADIGAVLEAEILCLQSNPSISN